MTLFKRILASSLLCVCVSAHGSIEADTLHKAGFDKLSETQKAEIVQRVAQAASTTTESVPIEDKIDKWVTIGTNIGKGMSGAAKELGIAANEFIQTPVGKLTAGLIVWKVMGDDIRSFFGSFVFLFIGIFVLRRLNNVWYRTHITHDPDKLDIFRRSRIVETKQLNVSDESETVRLITNVVGSALIVIVFGVNLF